MRCRLCRHGLDTNEQKDYYLNTMKSKKLLQSTFVVIVIVVSLGAYALHSGWFEKNTRSRNSDSIQGIYDGHYEYCNYPDACNFIEVTTIDNYTRIFGQAYYLGAQQTNTGQINGELLYNNQQGQASYDDGTCLVDFTFSSSRVSLKEKVYGMCGGVNVTFDGNYAKKEIDQRLVGVWQNTEGMGSGWTDRYQFYPNGAYAFIPNQMKCDKRLFVEAGTYELSGDTLILTKKMQQVAVGGQLVDATGSCGTEKDLINATVESKTLTPPVKVTITLKDREKQPEDNNPSLFFNKSPYWKFPDPIDYPDLLPYPQFDPERCYSYIEPCTR